MAVVFTAAAKTVQAESRSQIHLDCAEAQPVFAKQRNRMKYQ